MRAASRIRTKTQRHRRSAYTLVELLVVMAIIVIVVSMTLGAVSFTREADRIPNGAMSVQSFLAGARDRAIYEKEARGVRFFIEQNFGASGAGSRTVTTMAYIAPGGSWSAPADSAGVDLERIDGNGDGKYDNEDRDLVMRVVGHNNPGWWNLKRRGWLVDGLRIRIPAGPSGDWYPIDASLIDVTKAPTNDQVLLLQVPFLDGGDPGEQVAFHDLTYEIELPPRLLPAQPSRLPEGVVIDLDASRVPNSWKPSLTPTDLSGSGSTGFSGYMDIMFSPRGNITGDAASAGLIHFYICDAEDSLYLKEEFANVFLSLPGRTINDFNGVSRTTPFVPMTEVNPAAIVSPWPTTEGNEPYLVKERRLVSVFTQTGAVSVRKVNAELGTTVDAAGFVPDAYDPFDLDNDGYFGPSAVGDPAEPDGLADDPYRYAETGEVAK
ncbi:MAG: prepilin-type N-terminal cleavage/methylation domain-containing protein [Planctomycetaceae bacterium]|nr:prepilin-type N-terminal cleavage/methylation domain-containing protein [Planctomycetaceae bacterium]